MAFAPAARAPRESPRSPAAAGTADIGKETRAELRRFFAHGVHTAVLGAASDGQEELKRLLRGQVTEIGIAAAQSKSGRQRTYWALVVATPLN